MFHSGRIATKLLIWLTAIALPFQTSLATQCGCSSVKGPVAATSSSLGASGCCTAAATPVSECCNKPQRSCCKASCGPDQDACCGCGLNCHCVDRGDGPTRPSAPAPDNGRSHSVTELTFSPPAAICTSLADRSAHALAAEADSAFSQPGTQVCVLLCRFTL